MVGKLGTGVDDGLLQKLFTIEMVDNLLDIVGSIHLKIIDNSCLAGVLLWEDDALEFLPTCLDSYRQHSFDGT